VEVEEETGLAVLVREAWDRYHQPIAITEVHLHCHREEQLRWFRQVWETVIRLKKESVDIRAITSWALLGSYGWSRLLTEPGGEYEPGAFDLRSGEARPTALAQFIKNITGSEEATHPLSTEKGWWQRSSRLIYHPSPATVQISNTTAPILIIGRNGTLGRAFARVCDDRCLNYRLLSRKDCNLSDPASINKAIENYKPWAIINAAGFVRVDDAEKEEESCFRDNTMGAHHLAIACNKAGVQLVSFSSDLVFDGLKSEPYIETDPVNPLNVYGRSKAESEKLVLSHAPSALVIRTSAFFGPWDEYNFAHYVRRSLAMDEEVRVADDIFISPTYVPHLVHTTLDILIDREEGIWHLANQGSVSWAQFANLIAKKFNLDRGLIRNVKCGEMAYAAQRPPYTVLGSSRGHLLPSLEYALEEYFRHEHTYQRKVA
jgi:dTDP-4-dehydrorhamnose reductase